MKSSAERKFRQQIGALLPRLSRFGLALTRSRTDADDLIQIACERGLTRIDQWDAGTRLDSWMFRIMQTIWFNELRSRKVREIYTEGEVAEEELADDGEQFAEMRVMLGRVEREILRLPVEQRLVLLLVCVEGLTYKEAAKAASIPIGTVMSRLARARFTLMQRLGAGKAGPSDNVLQLSSKWAT
jgi:RNA polymerase sigma-70 factor, ECF subfamily